MKVERDRLIVEGVVEENSKGIFKVNVNGGYVLCTISGKIRQNGIRILNADKVSVELSEYDTTKGRIVRRIKEG